MELDEEGKEVELGRGAFGVVVKGTYRLAPVAIKRLKDQSWAQQQAFLNEMSILRACRGSRYIIPLVGASLLPVSILTLLDCSLAYTKNMKIPKHAAGGTIVACYPKP